MLQSDTKRSIVEIGIFSAVVNLLLLVVPLYLLQVYDRILPSSSYDTLLYISLFALGALAVMGLLDVVRARYASRIAARLDASAGPSIFLAAMNGPRAGMGDVQLLRDLSAIRAFVSSRTLFFLFDLPFAPLFVAILYLVHPWLFVITVIGSALLIAVALLNQTVTARSGRGAAENLALTMNSAQSFARNFETVRALGMVSNIIEQWGSRYSAALQAADKVAAVNAFYSGLSRTLRLFLQIATLGAGAWLVLAGEMTAGMIFAASIISGRAMQPLDQIVGGWPQIIEAARAWKRIRAAVGAPAGKDPAVALPEPVGALSLEDVIYYLPDSAPGAPPLIKRVTFKIEAGETVAIIGPSQAGKSTLARLIVGAIKPRSGVVRIDGADIQHRDPDEFGAHIGYLSQEVELFPGTIAQNISRFDPEGSSEDVIAAAERAQVHLMVLGKKDGYETEIGPMGARLSGGERQRIGLARAFYGNPKLVVLDEPNANLDAEGEQSLERAIIEARARKATVIIITHRRSIAAKCDRVMLFKDGQIDLYGPAREVLLRLSQGAPGQAAAPDASTAREADAAKGPHGVVRPLTRTGASQ